MFEEKTEQLRNMIDLSENIVFFGGAGVSTESGIPDFRSDDGLYSKQFKYPPEYMLTRRFYDTHTEEFYDFYRNKILYPNARPNAAHKKLKQLEEAGKLKAVVTQNIDGLHQAAGSKQVLELHGSVHRNFCVRCGRPYPPAYIQEAQGVPLCACGGVVKPGVVLYEEVLDQKTMDEAQRFIRDADMLIVGGTSLVVYPAAGLIRHYKGSKLVLINKGGTAYDNEARLVIGAPIGETLSKAWP